MAKLCCRGSVKSVQWPRGGPRTFLVLVAYSLCPQKEETARNVSMLLALVGREQTSPGSCS